MRGIHTCCPEAPSTINITQNIIEMDGTRAFWAEKYLTGAQYLAVGYILLDYVPYTRSQASLVLNSGTQRQPTDFVIDGNKVYLAFTPQPDDKLHFRYFALTDSTSTIVNDSTLPTGSMIGFSGTTIPDGWLDMDGTTKHTLSVYPNLVIWLVANPDYYTVLGGDDEGKFTLRSLNTPYYDGTTLVTGKTIIKT